MLGGGPDRFTGDRSNKAKPGDFLHTPRGVPHRFGNGGVRPARMLLTYAPAGFERWFLGIGAPVPAGPRTDPPRRRGRVALRRALHDATAPSRASPCSRSAIRSAGSSSPMCSRAIGPPNSPVPAVRVTKPVVGSAKLS